MSSEVRDKSLLNNDQDKPASGAELIAELRSSGVVGMWKDRKELGHSSGFSRHLRNLAYQRKD